MDFSNFKDSQKSPLANRLFRIEGVENVLLGTSFLSVRISSESEWILLKPDIFAAITEFYASGEPILVDETHDSDTKIQEDDTETIAFIKELLETKIRPAVQEDGGDIVFREFNEKTGIVKVEMQGACSGCPSSSLTLKSGIENMLMYYVSEVEGVEEYIDEEREKVSEEQLKKLEEGLQKVKKSA